MERRRGGCLVCGRELVYSEKAREMTCVFCGKKEQSQASCRDGHYVCDACHARKGLDVIRDFCRETKLRDPVAVAQRIMEDPYIYMHGPEHHVLAGAALLAAFCNSGGQLDLEKALSLMEERGSQVPGGACGFWGCCGAGVSAGIYMSIVTGATPLGGRSWGLSNRMTARALAAIGEIGGPRCCKRDTFTAIREAVDMTREELGVEMELPRKITCAFSEENPQCRRGSCPYYQDADSISMSPRQPCSSIY